MHYYLASNPHPCVCHDFTPMERLLSWKRLCFFLIAVSTIQSGFLYSYYGRPRTPSRIFDFAQPPKQTWVPNKTAPVDRHKAAFSTQQCTDEFPELYYEVDRAVAYWKDRHHTISEDDVDISWRRDGAARVLIHENELRILETKGTWVGNGYKVRMLSVFNQIQQALWSASAAGEQLPTIEAAIVVDDMSLLGMDKPRNDSHSVWTFTSNVHDKNHKRHWLIPDFNFWSSKGTGAFEDMRYRAKLYDTDFIHKIPKVVWRGVKWTNEGLRGPLLNVTNGTDWADAKIVNWKTRENIMSMDEMCRYAFTVHTEGRSYSGRLPFLLNCNSVPIVHDLDWTTHLYHLLIKDGEQQNYVPVRRDFSNLEGIVNHYLDHPSEAQKVIANSVATFRERYTTPAATSCYFRRLIAGWAEVSFTPNAFVQPVDGAITQRRGVSFAEFMQWDHDLDDEHD